MHIYIYIYIYIYMYFKCHYSCNGKAEFSAALLQSSLSHDPYRNHSNILIAAQETFHIIFNVENKCFSLIFMFETMMHLFS